MYNIIISDDEKIERDYIKNILNKHSTEFKLIGEASNGKDVIELAFRLRPDIIIMDIKMPLYDGLEASRIIKLHSKNIIIILNSAYSEFEFAQKAISYGLDGYLLKPSSERIIIDTIKKSLEKQDTLSLPANDLSFFNISNSYPNITIEKIIESMHLKDIYLIRSNIEAYLFFLEDKKEKLTDYKLHIINTMFTLLLEMQTLISQNAYKKFYNLNHLSKISRENYTHDLYDIVENFFNTLIYTLDEELQLNYNCEDIIQKYIDSNFTKEITLESLSQIFHFNPSYISRSFHKSKGVTIGSYINQKRINHAINLLKNSNLLIKDIALESGFKNISHFNKVFKDISGKKPSNIERRANR